jgi:capsular polysaccharide biosynthesis protein
MELKDYLRIIGRSWSLILGITAIVAILTILWSVLQPVKYESSQTLVVTKPNTVPQRAASYYQYDKYYSLQASSLYADTLASWLADPGTAKDIFEKAGYPVPAVNLRKLSRIFKPQQYPPVTLRVTAKDQDRNKAEKLVKTAAKVASDKTDQQNKGDDPDHYFAIIAGSPVTVQVKQDMPINGLLGLIAGLIIGSMTAFLKDYLRKEV